MKTEDWVRRLNKLGRELDASAASMHPSAWPEALKRDREKWKKVGSLRT